ncbi:MAG: phosphopantetheine-binding protein [Pseudomonadota bacterium]
MAEMKTFLIETTRTLLTEGKVDHSEVSDDELWDGVLSEIGLDSMRYLQLVMSAEKEYEVDLAEDDITLDLTMRGLAELISA